ncbi:MAG: hypothetical protein IPP51_00010 [Bacteroidetes bacterium]|nr:hypothetical protein [Bacteroidota bacterium]
MEVAKQIYWQEFIIKITAMTYYDQIAGAMTYEQVCTWMIESMSLRIEDPTDPNPLHWSVVGWGHKQSFCLMDYGTCSYYNGHCRDDQSVFNAGTILLNSDFPNFGLSGRWLL